MKKNITSLTLCFIFLFSLLTPLLFTGCKDKRLNWNGLSIANFEDYTGIGAVSFASQSTSKATYADEGHHNGKMKLAGFKEDNSCVEIEFEDDKGNIEKQNAHLLHFDAYTRFTLLSFTTDKNQEFVVSDKYNYRICSYRRSSLNSFTLINSGMKYINSYFFILDNLTGKIYDFYDIIKAMQKAIGIKQLDITFSNLDGLSRTHSDPGHLMTDVKATDYNSKDEHHVFQISFKENNIEVVQRLNHTQRTNFGGYSDKYGNLVNLGPSSFADTCSNTLRYQKSNGQFETKNEEGATFTFGANYIVYMTSNNKTYYLNATGEFEEIDMQDTPIVRLSSIISSSIGESGSGLLYRKGNEIYYKILNTTYSNSIPYRTCKVIKLTLDETYDWKYSYEEIYSMEGMETFFATIAQGNNLYINTNPGLSVYNFITKETTIINSQYIFTSFKN